MNEIDPKKWYKPRVIADNGWIQKPSISYVSSNYAYILDLIKEGILEAKNYGKGKTPYYAIKGEEIIRFNEINE